MSSPENAHTLTSPWMAAVREQTFAWRRGVVIRLAARIHARILIIVYLFWVCHRLFFPGPRDPYTLVLAIFLFLTYFVSLGFFALLCAVLPRQEVTISREGITRRSGRRESHLPWDAIEKIEHSVDPEGQLVVMSLFARGRRELVFTEGYSLDDLATAIHAAAGISIPVTLLPPMVNFQFLARHWPLAGLTIAVISALLMEWLPRWLG